MTGHRHKKRQEPVAFHNLFLNTTPDSEIQAKVFADTVEKRVKILVITFAHFHTLISMKVATRNFMKNLPHIPRGTKQHSFMARFWEWGVSKFGQRDWHKWSQWSGRVARRGVGSASA